MCIALPTPAGSLNFEMPRPALSLPVQTENTYFGSTEKCPDQLLRPQKNVCMRISAFACIVKLDGASSVQLHAERLREKARGWSFLDRVGGNSPAPHPCQHLPLLSFRAIFLCVNRTRCVQGAHSYVHSLSIDSNPCWEVALFVVGGAGFWSPRTGILSGSKPNHK